MKLYLVYEEHDYMYKKILGLCSTFEKAQEFVEAHYNLKAKLGQYSFRVPYGDAYIEQMELDQCWITNCSPLAKALKEE
jgi:hypothetical protein